MVARVAKYYKEQKRYLYACTHASSWKMRWSPSYDSVPQVLRLISTDAFLATNFNARKF